MRDAVTDAAGRARSGKGRDDENFPVASWLVARRHRPLVHAFYRFARAADDVADHAVLSAEQKLATLGRLETTLLGNGDAEPEAVPLRMALAERGMAPEHALDLLTAFRRDVTKRRYASWDELLDYCRYSAAPVGRFMLDVHGEPRSLWPANDALCAALQINNHLQDCAKDYRDIDRVYLPDDALAAAGANVADLGRASATPALRRCLAGLVERTRTLLAQSDGFAKAVGERRLGAEIAVIHALAERILDLLSKRDPLSANVHLSKMAMARIAAWAALRHLVSMRSPPATARGRPA